MEPDEKEVEDILKILDDFTARGESRLKIQAEESVPEGQVERRYHLGRCDVGSPWAKGQAFDVLETDKENK
ncbi:MAG: hypothetical protein LUC90_09755 [Lachnospiraceae bacterium]|nr:hypothetical protein [Lachnospiraceae bacterium]